MKKLLFGCGPKILKKLLLGFFRIFSKIIIIIIFITINNTSFSVISNSLKLLLSFPLM